MFVGGVLIGAIPSICGYSLISFIISILFAVILLWVHYLSTENKRLEDQISVLSKSLVSMAKAINDRAQQNID